MVTNVYFFVVLPEIFVAFSSRVHVLVQAIGSCMLELLSHCISTNVHAWFYFHLCISEYKLTSSQQDNYCAEPAAAWCECII